MKGDANTCICAFCGSADGHAGSEQDWEKVSVSRFVFFWWQYVECEEVEDHWMLVTAEELPNGMSLMQQTLFAIRHEEPFHH